MNIFVNDRSDLDQVVAIVPSDHPSNASGVPLRITLREDLQRSFDAKRPRGRRDVVLVSGTRSGRQYFVEVTPTGLSGDLFVLDFLTEEHYERVQFIAERMRQNALTFEPAELLLAHD